MNKQGLYALYNDDDLYSYMQNCYFKDNFSYYYFKIKKLNNLMHEYKENNKTLENLLQNLNGVGPFSEWAFIRTLIRFLIKNKYDIRRHSTYGLYNIFYYWSAGDFLLSVINIKGDSFYHILRYVDYNKYKKYFIKKALIEIVTKNISQGLLDFGGEKTLLDIHRANLKIRTREWIERNEKK